MVNVKKLIVGSVMVLGIIGACAAGIPRFGCTLINCPFIISCGAVGLRSIKYDDIDKLKVIIITEVSVFWIYILKYNLRVHTY